MTPALLRLAAVAALAIGAPYLLAGAIAMLQVVSGDGVAPLWMLTAIVLAGGGWVIAAVLLYDRSFWRRRG